MCPKPSTMRSCAAGPPLASAATVISAWSPGPICVDRRATGASMKYCPGLGAQNAGRRQSRRCSASTSLYATAPACLGSSCPYPSSRLLNPYPEGNKSGRARSACWSQSASATLWRRARRSTRAINRDGDGRMLRNVSPDLARRLQVVTGCNRVCNR
jgi:hypothetical protein